MSSLPSHAYFFVLMIFFVAFFILDLRVIFQREPYLYLLKFSLICLGQCLFVVASVIMFVYSQLYD